jgi:hypothetical protein
MFIIIYQFFDLLWECLNMNKEIRHIYIKLGEISIHYIIRNLKY